MAGPREPERANLEAALLEASPDAILVFDSGGAITYASPAATEVFGHTVTAVTGRQILDLVHPEDRESVLTTTLARLRASGRALFTCRIRFGNGAWRPVECHARDARRDPRIAGTVVVLRDASDRADLAAEIQARTLHDHLTGLANRLLLRDRILEAVTRSRRDGGNVALLTLDLDGFQHLNERHGHDVADQVLRVVGARLSASVRDTDTVARIGGDEFGLLLRAVDGLDEAREIADRIQVALRVPVVVDGTHLSTGASVGIAIDGAGNGSVEEVADRLLRDADAALHAARHRPAATPVVFEPELRAAVTRRLDLEDGLRYALANDEFMLHYQPIVRLSDGEIIGVEALLRWHAPDHGLVSPGEFIPLAEETGLIVPIGAWVLHEACGQLAAWHRRFPSEGLPLGASVNVSPVQLASGRIVTDVADALAASGLPSGCLTLEVTESALRTSVEETRQVLEELKGLGVRIAVDDFGTGYSSLAYLNQLPVDVLKIDRSFIDGMSSGRQSPAVVQAIVSMGHSLALETVAEGIEEPLQLEQSRALHCDSGQGFLFARPGRGIEIEALLAARLGEAS